MPALSIEELEKLQKSTQSKTTTTALAPTQTPSGEKPKTEVVSLALPKKTTYNKHSALEQFEETHGGRDVVAQTLELVPLDRKQQHFLNLLTDPRRKEDSIHTIAKDSGLKAHEIIDLFRSATFARGHALALTKMAEALPDVAEDIAAKSVDAKIECPSCFGAGEINNVQCPQCFGKGAVMRFSDIDRQKILLEATGINKKGPGVAVQVNTQINNQPPNFFSRFVKQSDDVAYDVEGGDIIDASAETKTGSD